MATVYLCRDTKFDRLVAIKLLHPDLAAAVGADRFHREIKIATGMTHPNILPAHDSGEAEGSLYYVMPFVEGESLRARMDRERQLPVQDAVRITCEIASALHYAHSHGIVHRDIKPENILLEAEHAVLADFGIARAFTSVADVEVLTKTGMSLGTPGYMSPEQALGEKNIDGRSDQYSLACVAYEMLTGQPPFVASTMQALVAKHLGEPAPLISTVRPSVPDELEDVILRALEKVPADRFQSSGEFGEALANVVATTGTWARRSQTMRTMEDRLRATRNNRSFPRGHSERRKYFAIGAAAMLLILAGGGAWQWSRSGHKPTAQQQGAGALDPHRVAVLYFEDRSFDGSLEPVARGLTESLIDRLGAVRALDIVSKNGVAPFRVAAVEMDSVGAVLKAGSIVRGSVDQSGDNIVVQVRLVDGVSGADVGERASFNLRNNDVALIDSLLIDSLAAKVAGFLRVEVGGEIRARERRAGTRDREAWVLVQRAEKFARDAEQIELAGNPALAATELVRADSALIRSAAADPSWAEPLVLRGFIAYRRALLTDAPTDATRLMESALAHAEAALKVSRNYPPALELRGTVRYQLVNRQLEQTPARAERLVREAEEDLKAAVRAMPSLANAWYQLSDLHFYNSDLINAQLAGRRAYEEDAYLRAAPSILWTLFSTSYEIEDFIAAEKFCNEGFTRFPANPQFVRCQLFVLTTKRDSTNADAAWRLADQWVTELPAQSRELQRRVAHGLVAIVLAKGGRPDSALHVIERSRGNGSIDPQRSLFQYEAYVRLLRNERKEALDLLQQYVAVNPEIRTAWARRSSWWWRDLKDDPRFITMIQSGS
jgi:eukaryotic-like serine/threonine-protein kinase